jgi:hypothetical protein
MTDFTIFKIFSPKKSAIKFAFFTQNKAKLWKIDHIIGFWEKRLIFRRILAKIEENCDHNIDPKSLWFKNIFLLPIFSESTAPVEEYFWQFIFRKFAQEEECHYIEVARNRPLQTFAMYFFFESLQGSMLWSLFSVNFQYFRKKNYISVCFQ